MSRDGYRGPKLPRSLLDKVQSGGISKNKPDISRKDKRKAERQAKRQSHRPQQHRSSATRAQKSNGDGEGAGLWSCEDDEAPALSVRPTRAQPANNAQPVKSILKRTEPLPEQETEDDGKAESDGEGDIETDREIEPSQPVVSRSTKRKLEEDDAEIAALEKKLRIKGKKSKALHEDGLDWLTGGLGGESEDEETTNPEDLDWLKNKRRKAGSKVQKAESEDEEDIEVSTSSPEPAVGGSPAQDEFEGFSSGEEEADSGSPPPMPPKRQKENPYTAPGKLGGVSAPKYVPPSLRKPASSDEEMLRQLHRQVQGKVNKVSESNMISILREVEDLYKENARQHVTSTLIDILISLMTADVAHPDTVLITNAAFSAAVYKVVGTDFGAQLLERMVERFDHFRRRKVGDGKQPLNLLAFLSYLYSFQVVGCGVVFDYIRILLAELTEENTEMLLRVIRIAGQQLRQDDPSALKDIVMLLQKLVAKTGEDNLSVRTKFMIETINNLKNNKAKTGLTGSAIAAEQTTRMKKMLGTLNVRAKATEPLRITLADIQDSEKKGKWWLVGASYHDPAKLASSHGINATTKHDDPDESGYESATPGSVNLTKLAKRSGMNTDVRRAIFISLLSASDYKDAYARLMKLHLKNKQQLEIPRVMTTCVGGEEAYNAYYALVAKKFCAEHRLRKAFQFTLWGFWRELEKEAGGKVEEEGSEAVSVRKVVNLAKFYATLVADGSLSLAILKKLNFTYLPAKESMFVEVFVTSVLFQLHKEARKQDDSDAAFEEAVTKIFSSAGVPGDTVSGLQYFVRNTVEGSDLARTKKEKKALATGCRFALDALASAAKAAPVADVESEEESDG